VVDAAAAIVGRAIPETVGPRRAGDPPVLVASPDRAHTVLGWKAARPTLEEMIGSAWAWRRAHLDASGSRIA
jgi:UDP-glucose 4-epimerase